MYSLLLKNQFQASHFLFGKDFGAENFPHAHQYGFEIEIKSHTLDQYNYLIDIVEMRSVVDNILSYFKEKTLNELPEFQNQNPSLELFCKILWQKFKDKHELFEHCRISIRLWEDDIARAAYWE